MLRKLNFKIYTNIVLLLLVMQLNRLTAIYEKSQVDFSVPAIEHLQKTPIEAEIKQIYKHTPQGREIDHFDHRYYGNMTACFGSPTFYY